MWIMRLLLIEDNARLGGLIQEGLVRDGFAVDWAQTLDEGVQAREAGGHDLILLDLGLPDGDGLDLVRKLRRANDATPILILTSRDGLGDRVLGLDAGADDYLVKPFDLLELAARCRAVLRRPGNRLMPVLVVGALQFDVASRQTTFGAAAVDLSRRESGLLEILMRRTGSVVTKAALEEALYDFNEPVTPNALEAAISRLRKKLDEVGAGDLLHTVRGLGYLLREKSN
jgi:DNA-binding response OmpR family regulator